MAGPLIDLLWRDHPAAPRRRARGPRSRCSTGEVVESAVALADAAGIEAVTMRSLSDALGMSTMSVYTHIASRADLIVAMADHALARMALPSFGRAGWRSRVHRVAEANLNLLRLHPWLLDVSDARVALGPGTIAKYDHELRAFDRTVLSPVDRDAALTFVLGFARSSAASMMAAAAPGAFGDIWEQTSRRLAVYLGRDFPLAQEIGRAAGESIGGPYDANRAWEFGLARVIDGLARLIEPRAGRT